MVRRICHDGIGLDRGRLRNARRAWACLAARGAIGLGKRRARPERRLAVAAGCRFRRRAHRRRASSSAGYRGTRGRSTQGPPLGDDRLGLVRIGAHANRLDSDFVVAFDRFGKGLRAGLSLLHAGHFSKAVEGWWR
jgi:hypothetical protein